ncbi:MAG: hypothetical protein N2246_11660, partial [Candidatus Sumerlaeia bacterium]|nr:hypothetical protein [Candidatus Sumerlaeia bacterium]
MYKRQIYDGLETASEWTTTTCCTLQIKAQITIAEGIKGKCLRLDYDFGTTESYSMAQISRKLTLTNPQAHILSFWAKSSGNKNLLEITVTDTDNSVFKHTTLLPSSQWKKYTLDINDFNYSGGTGDRKLDEVQSIGFIISTLENGSGSFFLDEITIYRKEVEPRYSLTINQIGYQPEEAKLAILKMDTPPPKLPTPETFQVIKYPESEIIYTGEWRAVYSPILTEDYLVADFTAVKTPGTYIVQTTVPKSNIKNNTPTHDKPAEVIVVQSHPFSIAENILTRETARSALNFLKYLHCGGVCHKTDPVVGGYHNSLYDYGKGMQWLGLWLLGLSHFI